METTSYVLSPRPAVRAFMLAAVLAVVGGAGIVAADAWSLHVAVAVIGGVLLALGMALLVMAVVAGRRGRVRVEFTDSGYRIYEPGGVREGSWSDVTKVTSAPGRITFHQGEEARVHLIAPQGDGAGLAELASDISRRLDQDRGYRPFV